MSSTRQRCRCALAGKQLENARGQQAAVRNLFLDDVHVGQRQREADGAAVRRFGEEHQARVVDQPQRLGHELEFGRTHGHEAPVGFPGVVVDLEDAVDFAPEILGVEGADAEIQPLFELLGDAA